MSRNHKRQTWESFKTSALTVKNPTKIKLFPSCHKAPHQCANVPLPQGWSMKCSDFSLTNERGDAIPCDFVERTHWPDNSIQWLNVSWSTGSSSSSFQLSKNTTSEFTPATIGRTRPRPTQHTPYENGAFLIGSGFSMTVEVELECGKLLTAKELKACSLASDDRRTQHLAGILTEDGSANDLELRAQSHRIGDDGLHRWTLAIRNPRAASHPGGIWELGDANSACIKRATVRF